MTWRANPPDPTAGAGAGGGKSGNPVGVEGLAAEMARAAGGRYYHMPMVNATAPRAAAGALISIVSQV